MLGWFPQQASSFAGEIDGIFATIYYVVGAWFVLLHALLFFMLVRFRRRAGVSARYLPGNSLRQSAWILLPGLLVLALDLWIDARGGAVWALVKEETPPASVSIRVTGEQFNWKFTYPGPDGKFETSDDLTTENSFHVPVDEVVALSLQSNDVIHSFFLPEFRLKQDAVPGRTIPVWFKAIRAGQFEIACAELCGFGHTGMQGKLTVHTAEDWKAWVAKKWPPPAPAEAPGAGQEEGS